MDRTCAWCGGGMLLVRAGAKFCSQKCGTYFRRQRARQQPVFPEAMTSRPRWVRAQGKRPITVTGRPASTTSPGTWTRFEDVAASAAGDGMGVMLGEDLACLDLDHCLVGGKLTGWARDMLAGVTAPIVFTEVSVSGEGLHVFTAEPVGRSVQGWWGGYYRHSRFIRVTGVVFDPERV